MQRRQLVLEHLDLPVAARAVAEQPELLGKLARQVIAHEAEVIVLLHDAARGRQALALDDLLPHREAEVIGVDAERDLLFRSHRTHHVRVALDGVEIRLLRHEVRLAQQPRVPVGRPALVHDLRGEHRVEIERLLAHREEDVTLPALHLRGVVRHEPQQVVLGMRRDGCAFLGLDRTAGRGRVESREALAELVVRERAVVLEVLRIARAAQRLIDVDVLLEGECGIERRFDALRAVSLDRLRDLAGVIGGVLDDALAHLLLAASEQQIVAREVRVPEHVSGHQDVLGEAVALGEIGVPGIAGKHHLEEPRVPHVALDELVDVAHAEGPVRHAHRQPVHGDLHHEAVGDRLEVDRVELQPRAGGELLDAPHVIAPVIAHGLLPGVSVARGPSGA